MKAQTTQTAKLKQAFGFSSKADSGSSWYSFFCCSSKSKVSTHVKAVFDIEYDNPLLEGLKTGLDIDLFSHPNTDSLGEIQIQTDHIDHI